MDKLQSSFKDAYETRGARVGRTETTYLAVVLFRNTEVSLSFEYNPQDSKITGIEITHILT